MKGVYKLNVDCGTMGNVTGVFIEDSENVKKIIGRHVDFGEALGKHSEIAGDIKESHIELLTEDLVAIEVVEKYKLTNGYNPFHYWICSECGRTIDPQTERCSHCRGPHTE